MPGWCCFLRVTPKTVRKGATKPWHRQGRHHREAVSIVETGTSQTWMFDACTLTNSKGTCSRWASPEGGYITTTWLCTGVDPIRDRSRAQRAHGRANSSCCDVVVICSRPLTTVGRLRVIVLVLHGNSSKRLASPRNTEDRRYCTCAFNKLCLASKRGCHCFCRSWRCRAFLAFSP